MLDLDPLQPIPGTERPTDSDDPNAFVAKLRYQQTKVDGVIPTILVEQAVVSVIAEQRQWLAATHPRLQPKLCRDPGRHRRSRIPQAQENRRPRHRHRDQPFRHPRHDTTIGPHRPGFAQLRLPTASPQEL
jgi:hypothetical protein